MQHIRGPIVLLVALMAGCGDETSAKVEYPEKPTCERPAVLGLVDCPDEWSWVSRWARPGSGNPEITIHEFFGQDEDPGDPWAKVGEYCVDIEADERTWGTGDKAYWQCGETHCESYAYTLESDGIVERRRVTCNLENDSVGLDLTTMRPGEEPVTEYWRWYLGAGIPEKLDL